jgi:hypothetical protein
MYLSSVGEDAGSVSASFESSTAMSSSAGSREYKSLNLVCASSRGGPVKFIQTLRKLKSAKTSPSNISLDSRGNVRDDVLLQPQSGEQAPSANSSFAEYDASEFEEETETSHEQAAPHDQIAVPHDQMEAGTDGVVATKSENTYSVKSTESENENLSPTQDTSGLKQDDEDATNKQIHSVHQEHSTSAPSTDNEERVTERRSDHANDVTEPISNADSNPALGVGNGINEKPSNSREDIDTVFLFKKNLQEPKYSIVAIEDLPDCQFPTASHESTSDTPTDGPPLTSSDHAAEGNERIDNTTGNNIMDEGLPDDGKSAAADCIVVPKSVLRKGKSSDTEDGFDASARVRFHDDVEYFRYPPRVSSAIFSVADGAEATNNEHAPQCLSPSSDIGVTDEAAFSTESDNSLAPAAILQENVSEGQQQGAKSDDGKEAPIEVLINSTSSVQPSDIAIAATTMPLPAALNNEEGLLNMNIPLQLLPDDNHQAVTSSHKLQDDSNISMNSIEDVIGAQQEFVTGRLSSLLTAVAEEYPKGGRDNDSKARSETVPSVTMQSITEETASQMSTNTSNVLTTDSTIHSEDAAAVFCRDGDSEAIIPTAIRGNSEPAWEENVRDTPFPISQNDKADVTQNSEPAEQNEIPFPSQQQVLDMSAQEQKKIAQMDLAASQQRFIEAQGKTHDGAEIDDIETLG